MVLNFKYEQIVNLNHTSFFNPGNSLKVGLVIKKKMKIISGGQTGVDRAALDAAFECGVESGGWCPEGRIAEDGVIPEKYPVKELPGSGYRQRTKQNVLDSDGTVIIYFDSPSGGTKLTIALCVEQKRSYLLIDAKEFTVDSAVQKIEKFINQHSIITLNVAGPRASGERNAYDYAKKVIKGVLTVIANYNQ